MVPAKSTMQSHVYDVTARMMHVPPFPHGLLVHGFWASVDVHGDCYLNEELRSLRERERGGRERGREGEREGE